MEMKELILKNRSYRRFHENIPVSRETLVELVDLARLTPSANNLQPLKFILSAGSEKNQAIFHTLKWAGYLTDWPGPAEGERPPAYIIIAGDREIRNDFKWDQSIAAMTILLAAVEKGLGGCIMGAFDVENLRRALSLPERYEPLLVISLGKPKETVVIDAVNKDGDIKYWRDENQVHHVPKRSLKDIILDL